MKYFTLLCLITLLLVSQPVQAEAPEAPSLPKQWTKAEVIEMLKIKAVENNLSPKYLIALALCESSASSTIQSRAVQKYGREQSFGIFQIHTYAHKNITPEMAKDPIFNTEWAITEIKKGKAPRHWVKCHKVASR